VRGFFNFCEGQRWITESPARRIRATKVSRTGRTGVFSDEQFTAIEKAVRKDRRTEAFIRLMRWGGMAITDAVLFRTEMIDADVLTYRRHKTDELAVVPLPQHIIVDLRDVPLAKDTVSANQPFRSKDTIIKSDVRRWQRWLADIFEAAGVTEVQTETGTGKPHSHCFRDTFAIWNLRQGVAVHTVAKMLGHSSVNTTERSYLPFVPELRAAHIAEGRKALVNAKPKPKGENVVSFR
jgi:integrase